MRSRARAARIRLGVRSSSIATCRRFERCRSRGPDNRTGWANLSLPLRRKPNGRPSSQVRSGRGPMAVQPKQIEHPKKPVRPREQRLHASVRSSGLRSNADKLYQKDFSRSHGRCPPEAVPADHPFALSVDETDFVGQSRSGRLAAAHQSCRPAKLHQVRIVRIAKEIESKNRIQQHPLRYQQVDFVQGRTLPPEASAIELAGPVARRPRGVRVWPRSSATNPRN